MRIEPPCGASSVGYWSNITQFDALAVYFGFFLASQLNIDKKNRIHEIFEPRHIAIRSSHILYTLVTLHYLTHTIRCDDEHIPRIWEPSIMRNAVVPCLLESWALAVSTGPFSHCNAGWYTSMLVTDDLYAIPATILSLQLNCVTVSPDGPGLCKSTRHCWEWFQLFLPQAALLMTHR